jgi:hypothetical protein
MTDASHDPFSREPMIAPDDDPQQDAVEAAPLSVEIPGETVEDVAVALATGGDIELMTRDEFHEFLMGVFPVTGALIAMRYPPPLQTLMTAPYLPTARPASDALYDLAEANEWLWWLIDKRSKWAQQMMAIGAFGAQLYAGVSDELKLRAEEAAARAASEEQPKAA